MSQDDCEQPLGVADNLDGSLVTCHPTRVSSMTFELSFAAFADRRGETFLVSREGMSPVKLELVEVEDLRDPKRSLPSHIRQDPFQLKLRGPMEPLLPQSLYTFADGELGDVQLFVVPIGPEDGSHWYNVVVN